MYLGMWTTLLDLTHLYFAQVPQRPAICLGRPGVCFQGNAFWPIHSPSGFKDSLC
jgi:hypothetical protein